MKAKRFKDSKPFKLTQDFSQKIKRKYFIYYYYQDKFILCEVTRNDPKSPYITYKQVGFMDCDTKNLLTDEIQIPDPYFVGGHFQYGGGYIGRTTYTIRTGKELRTLKSREFSMIYQTDSHENFMNKFNFELQQTSLKYNL